MNIKRSDPVSSKPVETSLDSVLSSVAPVLHESGVSSVTGKKQRMSDLKNISCFEISVFRSLLEKLACVNHGNSSWTWDHENKLFLLQAHNHIIEQLVDILTGELGESLCLQLERATIIVDLRPWKTNSEKTSLRIGFEENYLSAGLRGYTGLEDLTSLHFKSSPGDFTDINAALVEFKRMCARIDDIFEKKCEWMWETHWKKDGLAFAVARTYTWTNKSSLVEKEINQFNNSPEIQKAGLRIAFSTYNRGASLNMRLDMEGWPGNLLQCSRILDVFDTHYSSYITKK